jgi:hydrogenase maturation protein HypF
VKAVSVRVRLDITGVVQGVGFRPAVARIAAEYGLGGWVYNDAGAVHCEFEGPAPDVDAAVSALQHRPPPMARIDTMAVTAVQTLGDARFEIIASQTDDTSRTLVPLSLRGDALAVADSGNNRVMLWRRTGAGAS